MLINSLDIKANFYVIYCTSLAFQNQNMFQSFSNRYLIYSLDKGKEKRKRYFAFEKLLPLIG